MPTEQQIQAIHDARNDYRREFERKPRPPYNELADLRRFVAAPNVWVTADVLALAHARIAHLEQAIERRDAQ